MKSPGLIPLLRNIKIVGGMIKGTPFERNKFRTTLEAQTTSFGVASFWLTINLNDINTPEVILYAGAQRKSIKLQKNDRWAFLASDGIACAKFFDDFVNKLMRCMVGWKSPNRQRGVLGTPVCFAGPKETTGRGCLHYHVKIMTEEMILIRELLLHPELYKIIEPYIRTFVDSTISSSVHATTHNDKIVHGLGCDLEKITRCNEKGLTGTRPEWMT